MKINIDKSIKVKATKFYISSPDCATSFGQQLKYYRRLNNINAKDMAKDLNIGYNTIWRLEEKSNDEYNFNHKTIQIIKKIIEYLNIENKLDYSNNEYLDFIINKQTRVVKRLLSIYSKQNLAILLEINPNTISRWTDGKIVISKENYRKLKKMLDN